MKLRKCLQRRAPARAKSPQLKTLSLCASPMPEKIVSEKRNPLFTQTLIDFGYDGLQPLKKARISPPSSSGSEYSEPESQHVGWVPQIRSRPDVSKNVSADDLIPRPLWEPTIPAPVVTKTSHFTRLAAALTGSPKPSIASFEINAAPPYTSTVSTPVTTDHVSTPSPLAAVESPDNKKYRTPKKKQKPARLLPPNRADAPKSKLPRVPVPSINAPPVPVITVAEISQTLFLNAMSASVDAIKSPTRLDSARPADLSPTEECGKTLQVPGPSVERDRKSSYSAKYLSVGAGSASQESEDGTGSPGPVKKLPRLVIVVNVFHPTMEDELEVRHGEVLRLTHEFRDGWCAVERLGTDAQQGVIPCFCITERPSFVPSQANTQSFSNSPRSTFTGSTTYDPDTSAMGPRLSRVS